MYRLHDVVAEHDSDAFVQGALQVLGQALVVVVDVVAVARRHGQLVQLLFAEEQAAEFGRDVLAEAGVEEFPGHLQDAALHDDQEELPENEPEANS